MKKVIETIPIVILIYILLSFIVSSVFEPIMRYTPVLQWFYVIWKFNSAPDPPAPEITYHEFPFTLVYGINGKKIVVEDTIKCEFKGFASGSNGKWRMWEASLASNEGISKDSGVSIQAYGLDNVFFSLGDAHYYMGEPGYTTMNLYAYRIETFGGLKTRYELSSDELLKQYGIILVTWNPSPAIENSFK